VGRSPCAFTLTSKMFSSIPFFGSSSTSAQSEQTSSLLAEASAVNEPSQPIQAEIKSVTVEDEKSAEASSSSAAPAPAPVVREAPKPVVQEQNPYFFRPTHGFTSHHLTFLRPDVSKSQRVIATVTAILALNPPEETKAWVESEIKKAEESKSQVVAETKVTNARLLAERVVHKFRKWGPVRFGLTPSCRRDFYNGTSPVDTLDNPLKFDPIFESELRKQTVAAGLDADLLMPHIHLGVVSLARFKEFMTLTTELPPQRWGCFCGTCQPRSQATSGSAQAMAAASLRLLEAILGPIPVAENDEDDYSDEDEDEDDESSQAEKPAEPQPESSAGDKLAEKEPTVKVEDEFNQA
jgi:hypothetical protein